MTEFHLIEPKLENYYRGVILFGANVASYKFALGKSLIELAASSDDLIPIEKLAEHFSAHVAEHVAHSPKQSTRNGRVRYFDLCERYNNDEASKDELISFTTKNAFNDVIDRFHIVVGKEIGKRFYIDERKSGNGIRLTDELRVLVAERSGADLIPEIQARWRLVEEAWKWNFSRNVVAIEHEAHSGEFVINKNNRRRAVTSSRNALNGYQKGKCFFCYDDISIRQNSPNIAHVDHFFPHILKDKGFGPLVDGVWNLALACPTCNGSGEKGAKVPSQTLVKRLHRRNEYLIGSNHPLKETIILQTGQLETARKDFISAKFNFAYESLLQIWEPEPKGDPTF
jgi:hypothetical protein